MPTDKTKNQNPETPPTPSPDGQIPITGGEPQQGSEEHIRSSQTTQHETRRNKPQSVKITQIPKLDIVDSELTRKANGISLASVIVNGFLFLCTLTLAYISYQQAVSADSAAKTAQNTFKETKGFDSTTLANQRADSKKSDDTAALRYKREMALFNLQKDFYKKQSQYFDENKTEFETSHSPYLQITSYKIAQPVANGKKMLEICVQNQGTQTTEIYESAVAMKAMSPEKTYKIVKGFLSISKIDTNNLITMLAPGKVMVFYMPTDSISDKEMDEAQKGDKSIFVRVVIHYYNFATKKNMNFESVDEFIIFGEQRVRSLYFSNEKKISKKHSLKK